jgi:hypothetical protein
LIDFHIIILSCVRKEMAGALPIEGSKRASFFPLLFDPKNQ